MAQSSRSRGGSRRRVCARCGDVAPAAHVCRSYSPARAAAALDLELAPGATLVDVDAVLVGAPHELARVVAALPRWRRERLWQQLRLDADREHEAAA